MRIWNRAWSYLQVFSVIATLAVVTLLLFAPSLGLFITWYVLIPLVPISLLVAPGVWRNLCPVAVLNQLPTTLGRQATKRFPLKARTGATIVAVLLLFAIVPLRPSIFNIDGPALAIFTLSVAVVAIAMGVLYRGKSGWCSSVCPVYPVERLYGQRPLVNTEHAHCATCDGCVTSCYDLGPTDSLENLTRDARSIMTSPFAIFAASFPGFILGYFTIPEGATAMQAYGSALGYALASLMLFFALDWFASKRSRMPMFRFSAALAAGLYYWFTVPSIAAAAERMVNLGTAPDWSLIGMRVLLISVVVFWLFRVPTPRRGLSRGTSAAIGRAALTAILLFGATFTAMAQDDRPGSTHIFITYRCKVADRPALLEAMRNTIVPRFDAWKSEGVMSSYELLFNTVVDDMSWDMMAVLQFDRFSQTELWRKVEQTMPGGLSSAELQITTPVHTDFADAHWRNAAAPDESNAASYTVAIPYDWDDKVTYTEYASVYVIPAFDLWIKHGAIRSYRIFYNMYPTGAPWDGMIVFQYRGVEGLAIRDSIKQRARKELKDKPGFVEAGANKRNVRREGSVVVARDVAAEPRRKNTGSVTR